MIEKNIKIFKWYYFFWRFKPLAVMMIIYFSQITASYTQAMAIFAINNLAYAFFKIPGGFFSDQIGRKPIILLGSILIAISFLLLAVSGQFNIKWILFVFAVLWGVGEALIAGTTDALMFETMSELKESGNFRILYSKSMLSDQLGCAFGAITAMLLAYYTTIQYVAWLSVIPALAQVFISFYFIEPQTRQQKSKLSKMNFLAALLQFIYNKKLLFYTITDIFFSTLGDISHRFESAYFKTFTQEWIISLARVLKHFFGILGFYFIPHIKIFNKAKIYFGSICSNIVIRTIALLFNNGVTPFIHMFINFFYATASTAKSDILQHEFLPKYRATAQSIIFFTKGVFMSLLMLLLGWLADAQGLLFAMSTLVILRVLGLLYAYIWRRLQQQ